MIYGMYKAARSRSPKNRRPSGAGYRRGDDTRQRVIVAALRLFSQHGFEGASTRDIAKAAGVNAPALQYYFENKERLYIACVKHVIAQLWTHIGPSVAAAEDSLRKRAADRRLIAALCAVQDQTATFAFSFEEPSDWLLLVLREQAALGPESAFRLMQRIVGRRLSRLKCRIVGRLTGHAADLPRTQVRAMTLNGLIWGVLFMRRSLAVSLRWKNYNAQRVYMIRRSVHDSTEMLLKAMVRERVRKRGRAAGHR